MLFDWCKFCRSFCHRSLCRHFNIFYFIDPDFGINAIQSAPFPPKTFSFTPSTAQRRAACLNSIFLLWNLTWSWNLLTVFVPWNSEWICTHQAQLLLVSETGSWTVCLHCLKSNLKVQDKLCRKRAFSSLHDGHYISLHCKWDYT